MPNPNKRKGRDAEIRVAAYLAAHGFPYAEPSRRSGWSDDRGDIEGIPGVVVEVKDRREWDVSGWCRELEAEIVNARAATGAVVVKRRGTLDVGEWYAMLPVRLLAALLVEAGWGSGADK